MDSSSQPQQKNQRRKRKDPESRDFICKCGKSYLSYAAAYTHVKNKHEGDKQFLENISKPQRERLKRGRPKQRRQMLINSETQLLSIIQETILQIFQACKNVNDTTESNKIVLEGNEQLRGDELTKEYQMLIKKKGEPSEIDILKSKQKYGETGKIIINFIQNLNKHFLPGIAAKTNWSINYLLGNCCEDITVQEKENYNVHELEINFEKVRSLKDHEQLIGLWEGKQQIIGYITQAFEKWVDSNDKVSNQD